MSNDDPRAPRRRWTELAAYALAAGIAISAAWPLLDLSKARLDAPFEYDGDALLYSGVIKSVLDHGWFWTNPDLGAPGVLKLYDYPNVAHESLHLAIIKLMSIGTHDWGLLFNLYFLLGFPLITLTAMFTLRRFAIGYAPAIVASVLYAYLPSRLLKGEGHLFLDVFFQVPLAVLLLLWVVGPDPPLAPGKGRRTAAAFAICVLSASTSAYYSFFTVSLLMVGGAWASFDGRTWRNLVAAAALTATIIATMGLIGLPSIVYQARHGANSEVGHREPHEAEVFGMKIAQLLFPVDGHRMEALRKFRDSYNSSAPLNNENGGTSLGFAGGIGFLALIGAALARRRAVVPAPTSEAVAPATEKERTGLVERLAMLNLVAVLIATVGGFSSVLAFLVYPRIRTYSRFGVLIGFFAIFALALILDRLSRRHPRIAAVVLPVVLVWGLLDQASTRAARSYDRARALYESDREFFRRIEASVPAHSAMFVLPYVSFPEVPNLHNLGPYDEWRGYLHSTQLRWSFPTMRGRSGDEFVRGIGKRDPASMVQALADTGFRGIVVYRDGYADGGDAIERALRTVSGTEPVVSRNGRQSFFNLVDFQRRSPQKRSTNDIVRLIHPIAPQFMEGFFGTEYDGDRTFHWCGGPTGEIRFENEIGIARRLTLKATFAAARPPAKLDIVGDLFSATVELRGPELFQRELEVPPGSHFLKFQCHGCGVINNGDPRTLVWRIDDFQLSDP